MKRYVTIGLLAIALVLSSCTGDDDDADRTPAAPDAAEGPNGGASPPADAGQLPPEFIRCMADRGYKVKSSADVQSAPPQVLQACFGSIH
jgi:hypothetical protein